MQAGSILWGGSWAKKLWNALPLGSREKQGEMTMSIHDFNEIYGSLVACGDDWMELCMTFALQLESLGVLTSSLDILDAGEDSFTRIDPTGKDKGLFVSLNNTRVDGSESDLECVFNTEVPILKSEWQEETDSFVYCLMVPIKKKDCVIGVVSMQHDKLTGLKSDDFLGKLDMLVAMFGYLLPDDMLRPLCGSLGSIQRGVNVPEVVQAALELLWTLFPAIGLKFALIGCKERVAALFDLQANQEGDPLFSAGQEAFVLANNTAPFGMLNGPRTATFDCSHDAANLKDIQKMKESCPNTRTVLVILLRCSDYACQEEETACEPEPVLTLGLDLNTESTRGWGSLFGVIYLEGPREGTFNSCRAQIESCCKVLSWKLQDRLQSDLRDQKAIAIHEGGKIAREYSALNGGGVSFARMGEFISQLNEGLDRHKMNMRRQGHDCRMLQVKNCIGEGSFALVFSGLWQGVNAAIKIYVATADANATLKLATEVVLITTVTHPNIVTTYDWLANLTYGKILALASPEGDQDIQTMPGRMSKLPRLAPEQVHLSERLTEKWPKFSPQGTRWNVLVMEHCDRQTLDEELRKKNSAFILQNSMRRVANMPVLIYTACEIAYAMRHLHSQNIIHGDLKPANILLQSDTSSIGFKAKVTDFGTSRILQTGHALGHVLGTLVYMPPEVLISNALSVSIKLDVYSYGIILWEMYSRRRPYANLNCWSEIKQGVCHGNLRPQFDVDCCKDFRSLVQRCWAANVDERPTFISIAQELETMRSALVVHD